MTAVKRKESFDARRDDLHQVQPTTAKPYEWERPAPERTSLLDRLDTIMRHLNEEYANKRCSQSVRDSFVTVHGLAIRFFDQQRLYKSSLTKSSTGRTWNTSGGH